MVCVCFLAKLRGQIFIERRIKSDGLGRFFGVSKVINLARLATYAVFPIPQAGLPELLSRFKAPILWYSALPIKGSFEQLVKIFSKF